MMNRLGLKNGHNLSKIHSLIKYLPSANVMYNIFSIVINLQSVDVSH